MKKNLSFSSIEISASVERGACGPWLSVEPMGSNKTRSPFCCNAARSFQLKLANR